jgi:hypothetical protein
MWVTYSDYAHLAAKAEKLEETVGTLCPECIVELDALKAENERLRGVLKWALDYGKFDVSTDNSLHKSMHMKALDLVGDKP